MSDYTPNEDQVRDAYVKFAHDDLCLHLDMAREDARRGIAKIKADALRSAANAFAAAEVNLAVIPPEDRNYWRECNQERVRMVSSLRRRADRIEAHPNVAKLIEQIDTSIRGISYLTDDQIRDLAMNLDEGGVRAPEDDQ